MFRSTVVRYVLVGSAAAAAYLIFFILLRWATPLPAAGASAVAFVVAVILQYCAHASFTFGRDLRDRPQAIRFAITVAAGFVLSTAFMGWIAPRLGICEFCALAVVMVALPIINYIVFLLWVFVSRG